jgi:hypothetical protein
MDFAGGIGAWQGFAFALFAFASVKPLKRQIFNHGWTWINTDELLFYPCPSVFIRG